MVATIVVQDKDECVVISAHNGITFERGRNSNLFQDTSSRDGRGFLTLQPHLEVLQCEPSFQQIPVAILQIWVKDKGNATFAIKIMLINATALYDTGAKMSCMSYTYYTKLKYPHP